MAIFIPSGHGYFDLGPTGAATITITTPAPRTAIQRIAKTRRGAILASGTTVGVVDGLHVQARLNGGSWMRIATVASNAWSGLLINVAGFGLFEVRIEEATPVTASSADVGIGFKIANGGQSNMLGMGDNAQSYAHPTLKASVYAFNGGPWGDLTELAGGGSIRPLLASMIMARTGMTVGFINCAASGTPIGVWRPLDSSGNYTAYIKNQINAAGGAGLMFFWDCESNAIAGTSEGSVYTDYNLVIGGVWSDLGINTMPFALETLDIGTATALNQAAVRAAILQLWSDGGHVIPGPDLSVISVGLHLTQDSELLVAATIAFNALVASGFLDVDDDRMVGPQLTSMPTNASAYDLVMA